MMDFYNRSSEIGVSNHFQEYQTLDLPLFFRSIDIEGNRETSKAHMAAIVFLPEL